MYEQFEEVGRLTQINSCEISTSTNQQQGSELNDNECEGIFCKKKQQNSGLCVQKNRFHVVHFQAIFNSFTQVSLRVMLPF